MGRGNFAGEALSVEICDCWVSMEHDVAGWSFSQSRQRDCSLVLPIVQGGAASNSHWCQLVQGLCTHLWACPGQVVSILVTKDTDFCINPRQHQTSLTPSTSGPLSPY